jgi:putative DNA primase/helicase
VDTYLHQRGILLPLADLPMVLRYHPHLVYRHEDGQYTYHPAMVARVDDPSGRAVSLHRTYGTPDGHKANVPSPKKLMSPALPGATRGGAIRLYPPSETLAVAEGLETALVVRLATGLPVWSTICASGMGSLIVPPGVRLVVICADHDAAGLDAAKELARRLLAEQRRVKIITPDTPGTDWADLQEVGHGSDTHA